ncbi:MAG: hypothetical protein CM15mP103_04370 [Gammaproteobacteria bacterium]|nr:MAG: hypothetical protein CM15mP103_04370 [Gammaproteobacteria bacterium]
MLSRRCCCVHWNTLHPVMAALVISMLTTPEGELAAGPPEILGLVCALRRQDHGQPYFCSDRWYGDFLADRRNNLGLALVSPRRLRNHPVTLPPKVAAAVVIANMIGTGVFTSLGFQLIDIQSAPVIMMLWLVGGVSALCGA